MVFEILLWLWFGVMLYLLIRQLQKNARLGQLVRSTKALIDALSIMVASEKLTSEEASMVYGIWTHMLLHNEEEVPCACGTVHLHCDGDEIEAKGFKHTVKFCDVAE